MAEEPTLNEGGFNPIFEEDDKGGLFSRPKMYVLILGEIEMLAQNQIIGTVRPGEIFGEMAVIAQAARTATARRADPPDSAARRAAARVQHHAGLAAGGHEDHRVARLERFIALRLNQRAAFFVAQDFPMRHKDVLYVANSPAVELQKFLNILGSVVAPASTLRNF